jgi:cation diffusion facilitator family transporter
MDPANDDDDRDFDDPLLRELAAAPPIALLDRDLSRMQGFDRRFDGEVRPRRWRDRVARYHDPDVGPRAAPSADATVLRSPPPSMSDEHSTKHILQSLAVNLAIALAKGFAALLTGSGAMLAEAIHSGADCSNQLLLLLGVQQSRRPADDSHPLGYGRALYFWSFLVALLLFTGGGVFSIYEGVHELAHPEPVEHVEIALGILGFSLLLEGGSTLSNIREMNRRRRQTPFFRYLQESKDSDLVVIFGENAAASLGLVAAMIALGAAWATGDADFDAVGSIVIGVILVGVALFLAVEIKSLLVGERADKTIEEAARAIAGEQPGSSSSRTSRREPGGVGPRTPRRRPRAHSCPCSPPP